MRSSRGIIEELLVAIRQKLAQAVTHGRDARGIIFENDDEAIHALHVIRLTQARTDLFATGVAVWVQSPR
jgi:hypothetical protein